MNNFAISSDGIATALKDSASSLVAANNSYQEAVALIAAANKVVQDPGSVGAALRTISLRLRATSTEELEEVGEDTAGVVTSKSKLQGKIKGLTGVDILTETGAYRSTYEILLDISKVWEDMSDIDQAGLLEVIAGKTRSNTAAAILSNTKDLEEAFKSATEAEGSALAENEKYLDSIQGRIDLFTNSVQTMWNNALDSSLIKFIVNIGTELINIVDAFGLVGTALAGVFIYLTAFKKQTPLALLKQIWGVIKNIGSSIKANGFGRWIGTILGVAPALKTVTAETVANTVATQMNDAAKAKQMMTDMGLSTATGTLSRAQKEQAKTAILNAMSTGKLSMSQGNAMLAMLGYSGATMAADGSLQALDKTTKSFMATNPIGWILIIVSVISTVIMLLSQSKSKVEKLSEEISNLKSEISNIESEIESINSELETTQDRIAELLAMPSLSFVEQEELKNLQAYNAELERSKKVQEMLLESNNDKLINTTEDYIDRVWNSDRVNKAYTIDSNGVISEDGFWTVGVNTKQAINEAISKYTTTANAKKIRDSVLDGMSDIDFDDGIDFEEYKKLYLAQTGEESNATEFSFNQGSATYSNVETEEGWLNLLSASSDFDDRLNDIADGINLVFGDESFTDLKYGMSEEIDLFLDEMYAYQLKWRQAQGEYVKSDAISSMFDATSTKEMQDFGNALRDIVNGDGTDEEKTSKILENLDAIDGTIGDGINKVDGATDAYNRLFLAMETVGITAEDIADYFVLESGAFDSSTMEGIIAQYELGLNKLQEFKTDQNAFNQLFDEDGEVIETKISEMMKGADETTRQEFSKLVKSIKDGAYQTKEGLTDWESAMKSFSISGGLRGIELAVEQLSATNIEVFPGLKDEINGIIDSFSELASAVGDTVDAMDALEQARAEEAYSGSVSLETLEKLMQSTDNYADLIEVDETGAITLATEAQDLFIQEKINTIKKNAALALSQAQLRLEEAKHNQQIYQNTSPAQEVLRSALAEVGGAAAFVTSLWGDLTSGNLVGAWGRAKEARTSAISEKQQGWAAQAAEATTSVAEAEKAVANAQKMNDVAQGLTKENIKSRSDSSTASGGTDTEKDAEDKKVEDGWEELVNKYERELALITNERDLIEAEIDKAEARGGKASAQYYEDLIRNSNEEKDLLQDKYDALTAYLEANKDSIDPETWTEYNNELNETAVAIKECETNTIEWAEALREIDLHYFEQATNEISRLGEELDFVNSLLEDEEVADENGNWSDAGITRLGLYTQQMEKAAAEAKMYQDEIDDLNKQYKNGELSEEQYQEKLSDLVSGQQDAIQSYEDAKDGIVELNEARIDAIKEGIEKEIEAYEDLIDLKKEELDAERDLFDFRKNVQKQSKDIATLERRIASLSGSTSASDIAERRKLEAELREAQEGLNDTYYERSRDQQSQALDEEAEAFSESKEKYIEELEAMLENVETLITNSVMDVMLNADTVLAQLNEISTTYGVDLSTALTQPWANASAQAIAWKDELKNSMTAGEYAALIGEGGAITAFANGVATKMQGSWNTAQNAVKGYADFLTGAELGNRFSNTITGFGNQIQTIIDKWNGVKKAADDAYVAQTREATVGGTGTTTPTTGSGGGGGDTGGGSGGGSSYNANVAALQEVLNTVFNAGLEVDGKLGNATTNALRKAQKKMWITSDGKYGSKTRNAIIKYIDVQIAAWRSLGGSSMVGQGIKAFTEAKNKLPMQLAKGTLGLKEDNLAITDESWIGEEITLAAGKNGQLQYLKKGSAVMPADISANLVEWGKLNPNMMNIGGGANINMISNAVTKPELNFSFDSLVHVDNCSQDTLKDLEKMVDGKINQFSKQLNYAIKKYK